MFAEILVIILEDKKKIMNTKSAVFSCALNVIWVIIYLVDFSQEEHSKEHALENSGNHSHLRMKCSH